MADTIFSRAMLGRQRPLSVAMARWISTLAGRARQWQVRARRLRAVDVRLQKLRLQTWLRIGPAAGHSSASCLETLRSTQTRRRRGLFADKVPSAEKAMRHVASSYVSLMRLHPLEDLQGQAGVAPDNAQAGKDAFNYMQVMTTAGWAQHSTGIHARHLHLSSTWSSP